MKPKRKTISPSETGGNAVHEKNHIKTDTMTNKASDGFMNKLNQTVL